MVAGTVELRPRPDGEGHVLSLRADLPDLPWCATAVGLRGPFDLSAFNILAVDLYLPRDLPGRTVSARIALRAGANWQWYQASEALSLAPGRWVTLKAPLGEALTAFEALESWGDATVGLMGDLTLVQEILIRIEVSGRDDFAASGEVLVDHITLSP